MSRRVTMAGSALGVWSLEMVGALALVVGPTAPRSDTDALLARLSAAGQGLHALAGEFVQKKRVAAFKQELTSRGRFAFERPSHLEWRYTEPDPSAIVVDGDHVTLSLPDEPPQTYDLSRQPGLRAVISQMQLWLGGGDLAAARADYEITARGKAALHVTPRTPALSAHLRSIDVEFDPQTLLPHAARVVESSGDTTAITFVHVRKR